MRKELKTCQWAKDVLRRSKQFWKETRRQVLNLFEIGDKLKDPEPMKASVVKTLILMATAMGLTLFVSNLAALKIWELKLPFVKQLWPLELFTLKTIPVDAGIFLFPVSYAIGDLLVEVYGRKVANLVAVYSALFSLFAAGILLFARIVLPDYPGADNSGFVIVQSVTERIFIASVLGFLISQIVNNRVFVKLRDTKAGQSFRWRALISSIIARVFDVGVFEFLAFFGKLSLKEFLLQAFFAYCAGVVVEGLISKPTSKLAQRLLDKLQYVDGKDLRNRSFVKQFAE